MSEPRDTGLSRMDSLTSPSVQCGKGQVSISSSPGNNLIITHLVPDVIVFTRTGKHDNINAGVQITCSEAGPLALKS